ncbi:MAG: Cys-tRNA(Pro)/Cys-tRNA(Cys) deacylase [Arenicella sp.]|jgi:Cys-tRNA(Pro)/Cys-tRNA(Cys) deacylase
MTPAINLLKQQRISHTIHEYVHDTRVQSYGGEASEKLGIPADRIFKTLVVSVDSLFLAVAILPVEHSLNLKLMAKSLCGKKAAMADTAAVQRSTGYVLGGVSPIGQKVRLKTVIDESALNLADIFVSAGRRGLEIELAPTDLSRICDAKFASIIQSKQQGSQ